MTPEREREALELLVSRFAEALLLKLTQAEEKHGWRGAWKREDWLDLLHSELLRHVAKGDPLDVAAYCAFAWHHDWPVGGTHPTDGISDATRRMERTLGATFGGPARLTRIPEQSEARGEPHA